MRSLIPRCLTLAAIALTFAACSGGTDSPTAPVSPTSPTTPESTPPISSNVIASDLAVSAGNSIASDLEALSANEFAAGIGVATFDVLGIEPRFEGGTTSSTPSSTPSATSCTFNADTKVYTCLSTVPLDGWTCTLNATTKVYTCTKAQKDPTPTSTPPVTPPTTPTPSATNSCTYNSETHIYTCIKTAPDTGWECVQNTTTKLYTCTKKADSPPTTTPPTTTPAPVPPKSDSAHPAEVCLLDPVTHLYTCSKSNHDSSSTVRSYGYFDIDGKPMSSFVKGVTASIRYITKFDGTEAHDSTYTSVSHKLSDLIVSGFLGATRIWNGAASSSDTTVHREGPATRTYTGVSVDTLKAVTYSEDRSTNKYPLSGSSIRVMNYKVVSIGKATETTTVSQRAVVTYNGTKNVPIQVGVFTCTLNLDNHKVEGCK